MPHELDFNICPNGYELPDNGKPMVASCANQEMAILGSMHSSMDGFCLKSACRQIWMDHAMSDKSAIPTKKMRGNKAKGVDNGWSKLDPRMVRMARVYAFKASELASVFGVNETTIERIRSRKIWSHVQ